MIAYRPVVPLAWMQQSGEHYPQSEKINARISGTAMGDDVAVKMR